MVFDMPTMLLLLVAVPAAFMFSSAAGLGGSLILVPALAAVLGTKEGVALAALLLAANNLAKLGAYRKTLPLRAAAMIALAVMLGAAVGAGLMVTAPTNWVTGMVLVMILATFATDFLPASTAKKRWAGILAFSSGTTSGFSGTSGPLKGIAIRSLDLQRQYFIGAAAIVSLLGDVTKASVFAHAGLLGRSELMLAALLVPVMIGATLLGRSINQRVGERGYAVLFWTAMAGYSGRLLVAT